MPAMELPRELAAVSIDVLKAFISDVLIQVLQALYPRADLRLDRLLNEINILLPQTIARPGLFSGAAGPCSALSATTYQATTPKPVLLFQHDCLRFTCSSKGGFCSLCERNTERRCEPNNNFAPKQVEGRPLTTSCGAPIRLYLSDGSAQSGFSLYSSSSNDLSLASIDSICFEFSILSGALHDSWLHQAPDGVTKLDRRDQEACEVLKSKKGPKKALLVGGWMTTQTRDLRVRVKPCVQGTAGLELSISENSEARLGKDMQYKLLVRALNEETGQEVAQVVSQGFAVTTTRSKCNFKPAIVCLEDPLNRLEGLGTKTINRLQDVQLCIEDHGVEGTLPDIAVNKVETVRQFKQLAENLRGHCPKALARALLPEPAVEHAQGAVEPDSRMRHWRPHPDSQYELLYRSNQAQVRWSEPAALVDYSLKQVFLEGHMDKQHEARMMSLAGEAFQCWKQEGHPGWLLDDRDSSILDEMHQREMEKRSYEGMGTCSPTGSGQPPAISAHTGTSEQSIADMPGQQGSVQGLDRRALRRGVAAEGSPRPARQPRLDRYNPTPTLASDRLALDRQASGTEGPDGMSWQQLRQSLQRAAKASGPSDLGLEQEAHCCVLPGRPIETGLVVLEPAQATAHTTQAGETRKQPEGEVTEEDDGHVTEVTVVTELIGKVANMTTPAAGRVSAGVPSSDIGNVSMSHGRIPLAEQLQMPLSPTPDSPQHKGSQSSPMRSSSPSPHSTPSSSQQRIAPSPTVTISPRAANSNKAVNPEGSEEQVEGSSSRGSPSIPDSPAMSQDISMPDSSPHTPSNSPVQVSEARSHGQRQSSEALALSQALSLMPEHIPHESDVLGLDDIPSGTSSGLLGTSTALLGSPTGLWGPGSEPLGTSLCQLGTSAGHMSIGKEPLGMSAEQWGHLAAQLGNYASQGTHAGHTESADNARMGADILSLLAGTHRESLIPNTDRPKADRLWPPHISSDRQPANPGSRAAQLSSYSEAMMLSNTLQGVLQHGMDRQVPSNALRSLSQGPRHPMPGWNPFEQQVMQGSLSRSQSASAACSSAYYVPGTAVLGRQLSASPTSPHSESGLKRRRTSYNMDDRLPSASWGMHSPGQGPKQQPLSHVPTQGCYRQLLYPGLEADGSHAHMVPSEPTSGLITQGSSSSSSAIKTWLSVPIPPAVTPLPEPPLLHEA